VTSQVGMAYRQPPSCGERNVSLKGYGGTHFEENLHTRSCIQFGGVHFGAVLKWLDVNTVTG